MKTDEITKIKQTSNQEEVNEYLAKGYKIIKIFSTKTTVDSVEVVEPTYILGLKKENG